MKTLPILSLLLFVSSAPFGRAADSKRTSEYIIANSADYEGKEVSVDVAFVKPVQWKSPIADLAFFHALTIDRRDHKPGGHILVAVPAADSGSFAKKYGLDFDGRSDSDTLRGKFLASPGERGRASIWLIDTTGKAADLIKSKKLELKEEGDENQGPPRRGSKGLGAK